MAMTDEEQKNIVERLERANTEAKEILAKQAEFNAKQQLSGQTSAGTQPEKPKEETPLEYAKRVSMGRV
jgi:hypothetical protein